MSCKELNVYSRLPISVVSAHGEDLILADGSAVLDLYGGHCVNTLGAGAQDLLSAMDSQWKGLSFATNMFANGTRDEFLRAYEPLLPDGDWQVFLSNSGAEANENALKVALIATGCTKVLCFEGAFHGRTAAAEAVTDSQKRAYPETPFEVVRLPFGDVAALEATLDDSFAAVITEPIQSMAGIVEPTTLWLKTLRELCSRTGTALIFDEVQTGNGRLGTPFASQTYGVTPDIFSTAKGAAGGLPIGVTVIEESFAVNIGSGLLGSTFGGGPTVLAAATVVARRLASGELLDNVKAASAALVAASTRGPVARVRGRGLLLGLELESGVKAATVRDSLLTSGVLVGTSADTGVLRLLPPLTLKPESAAKLGQALENVKVTA